MAKKKKKKEPVEKICTFFLKTGQSIQIKGFEKNSDTHLLFAENDGRVHKVEKKVIAVEIEHLEEIPVHLVKLSTTQKNTVRMILKSGLNLNFDGWKIKGVVDQFLSDKNDLIVLHEDCTYISYGTLIVDPKEEEARKQPELKVVKEDGEKRTVN